MGTVEVLASLLGPKALNTSVKNIDIIPTLSHGGGDYGTSVFH